MLINIYLYLRIHKDPKILHHHEGGLLEEHANHHIKNLENLYHCSDPLLAMRRRTCPRLFMLPNEQLLHLLIKGQVI